jgi:hypothetical protein
MAGKKEHLPPNKEGIWRAGGEVHLEGRVIYNSQPPIKIGTITHFFG